MKWKTLFFGILTIFSVSACLKNLPSAELVGTAVLETQFAAETQTQQAVTPTQTRTFTLTPTVTVTPTATATYGPTPTPTLGPEYFHGSWDYQVPYVTQDGLKYRGRVIGTGCTAASVQMVLEFWNQYDPQYGVISAQELIDRNTASGTFNPDTGLNIMNTEDDLSDLDYYLGTRMDSNKEELLSALERFGPLLLLTKTHWSPFTANHMAVLAGYDPENDEVTVMDPMVPGGVMFMSYDAFEGIWSLNYTGVENETLRSTFFFVVPKAEIRPFDELFIPNMDNPNFTRER